MSANRVVVDVDRDPVAMGDDMLPHARRELFRDNTRLSTVLKYTRPDIRSRGWSWVAEVDGTVSAVWSVDHGVQLLVPDRRLRAGAAAITVFFRYFLQIDPQWLHEQLLSGAAPDCDALSREFAPIARERFEKDQRRRERDVPEKLVSPEGIAAFVRLGAKIDLHSDTRCRLDAHGVQWTLARKDSMATAYRSGTRHAVASFRPRSFAELWLATALGALRRERQLLPALPEVDLSPSPPLETMHRLNAETPRWATRGADGFIAQLEGQDAVTWYRFAFGRTLEEIVEALTI